MSIRELAAVPPVAPSLPRPVFQVAGDRWPQEFHASATSTQNEIFRVLSLLVDAVDELETAPGGLVAHAPTHYPQSGSDPLPFGTPVSAGPGTNAPGSADAFALSDHVHAIDTSANYVWTGGHTFLGIVNLNANFGPPVDVDLDPNFEGTSARFSRADHKHDLDEDIAPTWTNAHTWRPSEPTRLPIHVIAAELQTANLAYFEDSTGQRLFEIDPTGRTGIRDDPDAMLTIRGTAIGASELKDYIYFPNDGSPEELFSGGGWTRTTTYTLDCWIRIDSTSNLTAAQNIVVIGANNGGAGGSGASLGHLFVGSGGAVIAGELGYRVAATGGGTVCTAESQNNTYNDDTWHHIAVVHERGGTSNDHTVHLFIDGVKQGQSSGSGLDWNGVGTMNVAIGALVQTVTPAFGCQGVSVAAVRYRAGAMYSTLTAIGDATFTPLLPSQVTGDVIDYDFDEGSGFPRDDVSGNLINGTPTSYTAPVWGVDLVEIGATDSDLTYWKNSTGTILSQVDALGWLGIGVDPTVPLHVLSTQTYQATIGRTSADYWRLGVADSGTATYDIVSDGTPLHFFNDPVSIAGLLTGNAGANFTAPVTIVGTTEPQLRIGYDANEYLTIDATNYGEAIYDITSASTPRLHRFADDVQFDWNVQTREDALDFIFTSNRKIQGIVTAVDAFRIAVPNNVGALGSYFYLTGVSDNPLLKVDGFGRTYTFSPNNDLQVVAHAVDANGGLHLWNNALVKSNISDAFGAVQFDFQPVSDLTSDPNRYLFQVRKADGSIRLVCKGDGTWEFNGFGTVGGLINIGGTSAEAFGINFIPTSSSSGSTMFGISNYITGGYFSGRKVASGGARAIVGGTFDTMYGNRGAVTDTNDWAGVFGGLSAGSIGNSSYVLTDSGGILVKGGRLAGKNFGTFDNRYGIDIEDVWAFAAAAGTVYTNTYGLRVREQTKGVTINNGLILDTATAGYKALVIRDQDTYLSSPAAASLQLNATNLTLSATNIGVFGSAAVARSTGWSATNYVSTKSFDADTVTHDQLADVVGTLIEQLKTYGWLAA